MNIHSLFELPVFIILLSIAVIVFLVIMVSLCINRDKPHIQNRAPYLMLMITLGVFMDTIFKLLIVFLPF